MTKNLLIELPYVQIIELCNIPSPLVFLKEERDSYSAQLISLIEYVGGYKEWESVLRLKLKDQIDDSIESLSDVIYLFVTAKMYGYKPTSEIIVIMDDVWKKIQLHCNFIKQSIISRLTSITQETKDAFFYAQELIKEVELLKIQAVTPQAFYDINIFQAVLDTLKRSDADSRDIVCIADDENKSSNENLYELSQKAIDRMFELLTKNEFFHDSHATNIFRILPDIILDKQINILKQIADRNIPLSGIKVQVQPPSAVKKFRTTRAIKNVYRSSLLTTADDKSGYKHKLSAYSSSTYNSASPSEYSYANSKSYDSLLIEAESIINLVDRSCFWFGISKSCSNNDLKSAALAEGLLATGIDLILKKHHLNARLTLVDAFINFVISKKTGLNSIEQCAFALLSSVIWPQTLNVNNADSDGTIWIYQPDLMFDFLRKGKYLSSVGKIWITHLTDYDVAEHFLNIVSAYVGNDEILFKEFCSQLLTTQKLLSDCDLVVRRLERLLIDASPSPDLLEILKKIAEEIPSNSITDIHKINAISLANLNKELKVRLDLLPKKGVAPVREVRLILPDLLADIIKKSGLKSKMVSEPMLIIEALVTEFYPQERSMDLEFPVVVRNSDTAGLASDVVLSLNCKEGEGCCPNIIDSEVEFGDINPGQSIEKLFLIDIPDEIIGEKTEIRFFIQLRLGNFYPTKTKKEIVVSIRPSTQRQFKSSPYTPGSAVVGANFIGREKEISHIKSTLTGDSDQKVLLLYGIRRIGKTSILKNIQEDRELSRLYYTIFWDVEDFSERTSTTFFVQTLIERILDALPKKVQAMVDYSRKDIRENPLSVMEKFFQNLDSIIFPKRILLMIDEVDKLLHLSKETEYILGDKINIADYEKYFFPEVIAALRKCIMVNKNIYIIFSGLPDILEQEYQSRLFGLADDVEVKELSRTESIKIVQAGHSIMKIDKTIQDEIIILSGCQPYLLQVLCNKLFHRMKNSGRDTVANFDLSEVIEDIASKETIFTDYDSLMADGWDILYGLALAQKQAIKIRKFVSVREIEETLARIGLEYDKDDIEDTLNSYLVESTKRPLVRRDPHNSNRFSMAVGLIGKFLIRKGRRV